MWFITQIRALYRIEDEFRGCSPAERHVGRQEAAPQIWERLKARAEELNPRLLPKSTLGKAVNYFVNDYDALRGYLSDGRFEIDNNLSNAGTGIKAVMPRPELCRLALLGIDFQSVS